MEPAELIRRAEARCQEAFRRMEEIEYHNTEKVLDVMRRHAVSPRHFAPTTGYGYDDVGRDTLEALYAELFHTEAAIVRPQIVSGTHTLSLAMFGVLRPGDELLYASGAPYDSLEEVIGLRGDGACSLKEMNVSYAQVEMKDGKLDLAAIRTAMKPNTRMVAVQRSRGYSTRPSLMPEDVEPLARMLHEEFPNACLMVDNCYGEFVCEKEPSEYGADLCVGSLIKNPGGGLAPTGGYIVGREDLIRRISFRLTAPGIGREEGSYAASYRPYYQGLFMAPHTVAQAVKTAVFAARVMELLGYEAQPKSTDLRHDIIQMLHMKAPEPLKKFCKGIQMGAPVDSFVTPEPWDMPGYDSPVIMAAGSFVQGASIELSADAPMRPPYTVYLQGGLTFESGKLGILLAAQELLGE